MKHIEVVAAIIVHDGKVLATQRDSGEFAGGWEFPGGKIEQGERMEQALIREIHEELDASIEVQQRLLSVNHDYENFSLTMHCFLCRLTSHVTLLEHRDARWLTRQTIDSVNWLPADIDVVEAIKHNDVI